MDHDVLMCRVGKRVCDKRVLELIGQHPHAMWGGGRGSPPPATRLGLCILPTNSAGRHRFVSCSLNFLFWLERV
jgi:hypothetical protein